MSSASGHKRGRDGAHAGPSQQFKKRRHGAEQPDVRGVSKIKADMRQTRRLLAKDSLTPDVRAVSERRLIALEQELEDATQSQKERKIVTKYKKIKFFDRTKIMRRINQAKKALDHDPKDEQAQTKLSEARVDLYYVNRFPKDQKYVALYPEGKYVPLSSAVEAAAEGQGSTSSAQSIRDSRRRQIMRDIEAGTLRAEAEIDDTNSEHGLSRPTKSARKAPGEAKERQDEETAPDARDDFFADDNDDSE